MTDSLEKIVAGPCVVCGAVNYSLSMGGPGICPSCDCGVDPEVARLRRRVRELEIERATLTVQENVSATAVQITHDPVARADPINDVGGSKS